MQSEFDALIQNNNWSLVSPLNDRVIIGNKSIFKVKTHLYRSLEKRKSCVVTKGYDQTSGFDFSNNFNLVMKQVTIWIILTIALSKM